MGPLRDTTAERKFEYRAEAKIVAEACQAALNSIGKVTEVSRETGTISADIRLPWLLIATALVRISQKDDITEMNVQTFRTEGLLTSEGALKAMTLFIDAIAKDQRLAGKSVAGW